jgi:predicted HTH transcriptional regulator
MGEELDYGEFPNQQSTRPNKTQERAFREGYMAMQAQAVPSTVPSTLYEELIEKGMTKKHLQLFMLISRNPSVSYEELAEKLERSKKTVRRLEDDLQDAGYLRVMYQRPPGRGRNGEAGRGLDGYLIFRSISNDPAPSIGRAS